MADQAEIARMLQELMKNNNELKAEMQKRDAENKKRDEQLKDVLLKNNDELKAEFKNVIQAENTKIYKSLTEHMELCKTQIKNTRTELLSCIDQLHDHVDTRFTEQHNTIKSCQDRIQSNTQLINQQKTELEQKIDERINQVKRDVVGRVNPTVCFYKHTEDTSNQPKFWGDGNPIQFIRDCERGMDSVGDQLNDSNKIEWVVCKLNGFAA